MAKEVFHFYVEEHIKSYFFNNDYHQIQSYFDLITKHKQNKTNNLQNKNIKDKENNSNENFGDNGTNLPEEWRAIDIGALTGFTRNHLREIYRQNIASNRELPLTPEAVQDSLYAMAYDVEHNSSILKLKFSSSPVSAIVGILIRGKVYNSVTPETYMSPQVSEMKKYLQQKEREQEKLLDIIEKSRDREYKLWREKLSKDQFLEFAPLSEFPGMSDRVIKVRRPVKAEENAMIHFKTEIWPLIKKEKYTDFA